MKQAGLKFARQLRHNMTLPEMLIWSRIKVRERGGPVFRRQYPYAPYIFDFYCAKARLVVEIDGLAHTVNGQGEKDEARDRHLQANGFTVTRIPASDVLADPDDIADGIYRPAVALMRGEGR